LNNNKKFSEILVEKGLLKIGDINSQVFEQQASNEQLEDILIAKNELTYEDILLIFQEYGWKRINVLTTDIDSNIFSENTNIEKLIKNSVLPIGKYKNVLDIVIYNPYNNHLINELKTEYCVDEISINIDNKNYIDKKLLELFPSYILSSPNDTPDFTKYQLSEIKPMIESQYFNIKDDDLESKIKEYVITAMKNNVKTIEIIKDNTIEGLYKVLIK